MLSFDTLEEGCTIRMMSQSTKIWRFSFYPKPHQTAPCAF